MTIRLKLHHCFFIMLVENAIKHGVETMVNNAFVNIILNAKKRSSCFM